MGPHVRVRYYVIIAFLVNLSISNGLGKTPPLITTQPASDEIYFIAANNTSFDSENIERAVRIECVADGQPEPNYHWTKNGEIFQLEELDDRISQQPEQGTLVITLPSYEDAGEYTCFAINELGVAMSKSVFLREMDFFEPEHLPNTFEVIEGSPLKFKCNAPKGIPKPYLAWHFHYFDGSIKTINNSRLTIDPEGNLWFSNVTLEDASEGFYYRCMVNFISRNEYKLGTGILLKIIPINNSITRNELIVQYVSKEAIVGTRGKKIEIYCIYGGTPQPNILWVKDNQIVQWNDRITRKSFGKILVIENLQLEDQGNYSCNASQAETIRTSKFELKINEFPYFTNIPKIQNVEIGGKAQFECKASGIPDPAIKWIRNGKLIEQPNSRINFLDDKIVIDNVTKSDIGNFGCIAVNELGSAYKEVYLNVVTEQLSYNVIAVIGKKIVIHCNIHTIGNPKFQWLNNNGLEVTNSRYKILENGDLEINNVCTADEGIYRCYVESKFGGVEVEVEFATQLIVRNITQ